MLNRISEAAATLAKVEPTSLLSLVAGEFAKPVARVWPAPHAPFLSASAARRHLVCLAISLGREVAAVGELLLNGRLRRAIPSVVHAPPEGLERALGRMGEVAWDGEAYRALLNLLGEPRTAKALRHAEALDAEVVRRIATLPGALAEAPHLALELNADGVAVVREAYDALLFRSGAAAAEAASQRWAKAGSAKALFEAVREDLTPEPLAPPHPGTARLKPLVSKADLRDAARRYRNCLAGRAPYAATGWSAYYEWVGPPGTIVEVTRDHIFGWRLDEARAYANAAVPPAVREEIISELALMGIHVGRSGWDLDRALNLDVGRRYALRPMEQVLDEVFAPD